MRQRAGNRGAILFLHEADQIGVLGFERFPGRPIEAQQGFDVGVRQTVQAGEFPALEGGREFQSRQRVTDIMVAVPEGPFAIFPGFAPENAAQSHHEALGVEMAGDLLPQVQRKGRPLFQGVPQRVVMIKTRREPFHCRQDQMGLCRVQVSTRWVYAQRPAAVSIDFPGRQAQRKLQKSGHGG